MTATLSAQDALVAVMITTSTADAQLSTKELLSISRIIEDLPAFKGYKMDRLSTVSAIVFDMLEADDGLDAIVGLVKESLPSGFNETAYALACDVAASDGALDVTELRWLQLVRHELEVERLTAAAIERASKARHMSLPQ
jgi:tellurite resistance protein